MRRALPWEAGEGARRRWEAAWGGCDGAGRCHERRRWGGARTMVRVRDHRWGRRSRAPSTRPGHALGGPGQRAGGGWAAWRVGVVGRGGSMRRRPPARRVRAVATSHRKPAGGGWERWRRQTPPSSVAPCPCGICSPLRRRSSPPRRLVAPPQSLEQLRHRFSVFTISSGWNCTPNRTPRTLYGAGSRRRASCGYDEPIRRCTAWWWAVDGVGSGPNSARIVPPQCRCGACRASRCGLAVRCCHPPGWDVLGSVPPEKTFIDWMPRQIRTGSPVYVQDRHRRLVGRRGAVHLAQGAGVIAVVQRVKSGRR